MKLLVVIVCYKVVDLTIECLRSLEKEIGSVPGTKVALCENGTGGEAEQRLREAIDANGWGDWVELLAIYPNRGFTGGNNYVIRKALGLDVADISPSRPLPLSPSEQPEYVLLLNADTIVQPNALKALGDFMESHPQAGIAGSQLLSPEGAVQQASPFRFMGIATELDRGLRLGIVSKLLSHWAVVPPTPKNTARAEWVSGCSMIIRRQTLEEVGLLDEGLYTYFDDIDYCWRARKKGIETWYVPQSRIVHLEGASTGITQRIIKRRPKYWFQARRRFFLKNYGPFYTALCDAAFLVGFALWRVRRAIQGKPDVDPPMMLHDSIRNSVFVAGLSVSEVENPAMLECVAHGQPTAMRSEHSGCVSRT